MKHKGIIRFLLPPIIIVLAVCSAKWLKSHSKTVPSRPKPPAEAVRVDALTVQPTPYQVIIQSYGRLQAKKSTAIGSELTARVTYINPHFEAGQTIAANELLVRLENSDRIANVAIAKAELDRAQATYAEEQARAQQAKKDWRQLHGNQRAPELALRKPQLASAKASIHVAAAELQKAESALAKSEIRAPYHGIIVDRTVDLGELASPASPLGTIMDVQRFELRAPISQNELNLLEINTTKNNAENIGDHSLVYILRPTVGSSIQQPGFNTSIAIEGKIIGTTQIIEETTQKQHLIIELNNPKSPDFQHGDSPLTVGEFVLANIYGKTFEDAITIPVSALFKGSFVHLIDKDSRLQRKSVVIRWQNHTTALIQSGLTQGDRLITTPAGHLASGTPLTTLDSTGTGATQ